MLSGIYKSLSYPGTSFGLMQTPFSSTASTESSLGNVIGSFPTGANSPNRTSNVALGYVSNPARRASAWDSMFPTSHARVKLTRCAT